MTLIIMIAIINCHDNNQKTFIIRVSGHRAFTEDKLWEWSKPSSSDAGYILDSAARAIVCMDEAENITLICACS